VLNIFNILLNLFPWYNSVTQVVSIRGSRVVLGAFDLRGLCAVKHKVFLQGFLGLILMLLLLGKSWFLLWIFNFFFHEVLLDLSVSQFCNYCNLKCDKRVVP
jgi:hypothetical protein